MPSFIYEEELFCKECILLKEKLFNEKNSLINNFDYSKNLPISGLSMYFCNIWDTISNNKDLNLPSEKILVSNLRC